LSLFFRVDPWLRTRNDLLVDELSGVARDFGDKMREAREKAGLTQEALADLTGMSRGAISPLERGEHLPRLDTLLKLAGALGVEPSSLIADYRWRPAADQERAAGAFKRIADQ
jgi:transcriptional regulator with XRE-family HTH domain